MKHAMLVLATLAGFGTQARAETKLIVYVHLGTLVPVTIQMNAESMASGILRRASIPVDWRHRKLPRAYDGHPVAMELADMPSAEHRSDEIGFAYTSDGVHIRVYYDRIKQSVATNTVPYLLAYVMVHELAHLLEGGGHSELGIMKARWIKEDIQEMVTLSLPLAPEDTLRIQRGFASWTAEPSARR